MSIHRVLLLRRWIWWLRPPVWSGTADSADVDRCSIETAAGVLDARLALPRGKPAAAVLILHGIGETVEHWEAVQQMFAARGVASLVLDYQGFGRSAGWFSPRQAEHDAMSGFAFMRRRFPSETISIVGFSLGSGIAAAVSDRTGADTLVLCAAYPSLRQAARSVGLPRVLTLLMRDVWNTRKALRICQRPVVIVHGEEDRLFPPALARDLAEACGSRGELILVPDVSHDDPIFRPSYTFWGSVLDRLPRGVDIDHG